MPHSPHDHIGPLAVIDDDIRFIRMVERILHAERMHIQPVTTPDIDEAVSVVAAAGCQAALIDVYMYGATLGFALTLRLRRDRRTSDLPIIVTSVAHREIGRKVQFLQEQHCGVLLKPFGVEDLLARLPGREGAPCECLQVDRHAPSLAWRPKPDPRREASA